MHEPQISLCMIVKDEERCLGRCLSSLAPWVAEICIVDTGSSDRTLDIARDFDAKIACEPWRDDFAAARNASLRLATKDWILVVDADEFLDRESGPKLAGLLEDAAADVHLVSQDNLDDSGSTHSRLIPRLFRNHLGIEFSRRIHESIMDSVQRAGHLVETKACIHLLHDGYLAKEVKSRGKRERNERLLRLEMEAAPEDIYSLHKLSMMLADDTQERLEVSRCALDVAERIFASGEAAGYPFLPRVYANAAATELVHGHLVAALGTVATGLGHFPGNIELRFQQAELALRVGYNEGAQQLFEMCLHAPPPPPEYPADPTARGIGAAGGVARAAVSGGRTREAQIAVRNVRKISPNSGMARALSLEILSLAGQHHSMLTLLRATMATELVASAPVQLAIGDHAWCEGDRKSALSMWRNAMGRQRSVGQDATCRVALAEILVNESAPRGVRDMVACWGLNSEACRIVLTMLADEPVTSVCKALPAAGLLVEIAGWLQMIESAGRTDLLEKVAAALPQCESQIPGAGALLQKTSEPLAS